MRFHLNGLDANGGSLDSPPTPPFGFSTGRIATHAEVPDMVVPSEPMVLLIFTATPKPFDTVGELPSTSSITKTQVFLPVTLSFIAQKNCVSILSQRHTILTDFRDGRTSCCSTCSPHFKMLASCRLLERGRDSSHDSLHRLCSGLREGTQALAR